MTNRRMPLPALVAHRGNAADFPENTLAALGSAVELGLRHVEFDVQVTADHVPVVLHDADLVRVGGRPESVHALTWPQLADIQVGEVGRLGERFRHTYAPSLAQVVDAIAAWGDVTAFVEVKRASLRQFGHQLVLRRMAEVLQPVLDRCVLISFDLAAVKIVRTMTEVRIGWVLQKYDDEARAEATSLAPEFLFTDIDKVPESASLLWPGPWDWAVYEVRDLATARRCHALGARYIETMTVQAMLDAYSAAGAEFAA